jgi:hypothetical protein
MRGEAHASGTLCVEGAAASQQGCRVRAFRIIVTHSSVKAGLSLVQSNVCECGELPADCQRFVA